MLTCRAFNKNWFRPLGMEIAIQVQVHSRHVKLWQWHMLLCCDLPWCWWITPAILTTFSSSTSILSPCAEWHPSGSTYQRYTILALPWRLSYHRLQNKLTVAYDPYEIACNLYYWPWYGVAKAVLRHMWCIKHFVVPSLQFWSNTTTHLQSNPWILRKLSDAQQ